MKRMLNYVVIFSALLVIPFSYVYSFEWKGSLEEALEQAKQQNKPVFVYLYHSSSLREDFKVWNSSLVRRFAEKFVAVQMNIESHSDFVEKMNVHTFPAVLFYDQQGRELLAMRHMETSVRANLDRGEQVKRALTRTGMARRLSRVLDDIEEFALVESQIEKYQDNPKFMARYAKGLRDRGLFDQAEETYQKIFDMENVNPQLYELISTDYKEMFIFRATLDFFNGNYDQAIELMVRFLDRFPKTDEVPNAKLVLGMALYESGDKRRGEKTLKELARDSSSGVFGERASSYLREKSG